MSATGSAPDGTRRNPLPETFKRRLHDQLDELMAMYERGEPLWIVGHQELTSPRHEVTVDVYFKDLS